MLGPNIGLDGLPNKLLGFENNDELDIWDISND